MLFLPFKKAIKRLNEYIFIKVNLFFIILNMTFKCNVFLDGRNDYFTLKTKQTVIKNSKYEIFLSGTITKRFNLKKKNPKYIGLNEISVLYDEFGEDLPKIIDGYYLIIINDIRKKQVFIINNRYSNTYCYYSLNNDNIEFCDNLTPLLNNNFVKNINQDVISLFLNSGYSYSENMNFKNIFRMIPGYYLKIQEGNISHHKYYEMTFDRKPVYDINKALDTYEKLWIDAIKRFDEANTKRGLGSALSGGLDTSWVVLCASKVAKPVHTYTCHYQYSLFNESKQAKFVTDKCNGIHHKVNVTEKDLDLLPYVIKIAEEPILSSSLSLYKMMKEASKDVDTILTGDGGNNIYHHLFPVGEIHKYIHFLPYWIRKLMFLSVDYSAKITGYERLWELRYPMHAFSFPDFYENFFKNLICYRHFDSSQRKKLLKREFLEEFNERNMLGRIKIRKKQFDDDLINARFVYGNMQYVMTFHEKFAKSLGMSVFAPYQDSIIMEFLSSLPYDLMFKGNTFKKLTNKANKMYFQKLALKKYLPEKFVNKAGQPFDQPFHGWFERRPLVIKLLFKRLKKRGWYNNSYLDFLYNEHKRQSLHKNIYCQLQNHAYRIMTLLSLEIWSMIFLDRYNVDVNKSIEEFMTLGLNT